MPAKRRKLNHDSDNNDVPEAIPNGVDRPILSPSPRKSSLKTPNKNGFQSIQGTPSSLRKVLFAAKEPEPEPEIHTPIAARNDRSARKKSQQTLQQRANDDDSDEDDEQDEAIAAAILGEEDVDEEDDVEDDIGEEIAVHTPSKKGRPRKKKARERTPSPPPNLPPHELFFFQNRTGGNKTSANTFPPSLLLNHEDYFAQIAAYKDPHSQDISRLKDLHAAAFSQWSFELETGFNLCLYGYGSKRDLAMEFAEHLFANPPSGEEAPRIVIVNGYTPDLTPRDILLTLLKTCIHSKKALAALPTQPAALLNLLQDSLTHPTTLIIHSLDHPNLRRHQTLLSQIAAHPNISLLATVDTATFPLMWDLQTSASFRFLFHDATTFAPWSGAELEVVESVNSLLGRSGVRVGGREGVGFVLRSLPENARTLFRILVAELLASSDDIIDQQTNGFDDDGLLSDEDSDSHTGKRVRKGRPPKKATPKKQATPKKKALEMVRPAQGVEYRTLYHKAVEEFVCSSEVSFRTLLKEFYDHRMIETRMDGTGTERLSVPFGRAELESILEELV